MTSLARVVAANIRRCTSLPIKNQVRLISTSNKKRAEVDECDTKRKSENWISYGFSATDQDEDRFTMHALLFLGISVVFVFGGFLLAYRPADLERDWAQREAYLELRRREKEGLPLIDPNFLPLDKLKLPSDDELGDTEIII